MNEPVDPNGYVTVIGDVIKFDPAEVEAKRARRCRRICRRTSSRKYQGKPAILANAVINAAMIDLAKFIPPPMTPEEAAFDKIMKGVGPANGALRKGMDGSNAELVKTNTAILEKAFADTEAFWKTRGKADAMKFAQDARKAATASRRPPPPATGPTPRRTSPRSASSARAATARIASAAKTDRSSSSRDRSNGCGVRAYGRRGCEPALRRGGAGGELPSTADGDCHEKALF